MKVRVAVVGTIGKTVVIDTDPGAQIGTSLRLPDGTVATVENLKTLLGISSSSGSGSGGAHRLLTGLSVGDDHPQYTRKDTLTTRGDLYVRGTATVQRFALGTSGYYLKAGATDPAWTAPGALTKTDDTNVTLTLGGSASTALLNAASLTLGWTGQLSVARGGTGNSALAALTKTDDTNVTLTLGGSPLTALVNAASITVGWTGTLGVARGGTNLGSYTAGDMLYATGATTLSKLAVGAADTYLGISAGAPAWTAAGALTKVDDTNVTLTLGGTPTTALLKAASLTLGWTGTLAATRGGTGTGTYTTGDILYASATNTLSKLAAGTNGYVLTLAAGVPTWAAAAGGASGANPTASVGLAAVNGSATTYLRSDGAPALSQSITPTWTGLHTFQRAADCIQINVSSGSNGVMMTPTGANTQAPGYTIQNFNGIRRLEWGVTPAGSTKYGAAADGGFINGINGWAICTGDALACSIGASGNFTFKRPSSGYTLDIDANGANVGVRIGTLTGQVADLELYRANSTNANVMGRVQFRGQNGSAVVTRYSYIQGEILTNTNAAEDGACVIQTINSGTEREMARFQRTGITFGNTTNYPTITHHGATTINVNASVAALAMTQQTANTAMTASMTGTGTATTYLSFGNTGGTAYVGVDNSAGNAILDTAYALCINHSGARSLLFGTNNIKRMGIASTGQVTVYTPTSGEAFTVTGVSGSYAIRANGQYGFAAVDDASSGYFYAARHATTAWILGVGTSTSSSSGINSRTILAINGVSTAIAELQISGSRLAYWYCDGTDTSLLAANNLRLGAGGATLVSGVITADASGNLSAVSDRRVKKNIRPFRTGLASILKLEPVLHGYKKSSGLDQSHSNYAGFIAQNVKKHVPQAVGRDSRGLLTFNDRPVIAALVNAVKELSARLQALEAAP